MPENPDDDLLIERYCTKEHPWDHTPINPDKETIIHVDTEEIWEDLTGRFVDYWCPNCGHIIEMDFGPDT